jgi:hypothetical protein
VATHSTNQKIFSLLRTNHKSSNGIKKKLLITVLAVRAGREVRGGRRGGRKVGEGGGKVGEVGV